jgi:hypothetical protein
LRLEAGVGDDPERVAIRKGLTFGRALLRQQYFVTGGLLAQVRRMTV